MREGQLCFRCNYVNCEQFFHEQLLEALAGIVYDIHSEESIENHKTNIRDLIRALGYLRQLSAVVPTIMEQFDEAMKNLIRLTSKSYRYISFAADAGRI